MDERALWVRFACAALSALISDGQFDNDVDKDCETACMYADEMCDRYHFTFDDDEDGR